MNTKKALLGSIFCCVSVCSIQNSALSETCVGTLPSANCTLDEDTVAPLTIDNGFTLTVGADVVLSDTIDGSTSDGDGTIQTNSGGVSVEQTAVIGGETAIDELVIGDGDQWTTSADIITDNSGLDIDLGAGDGGEIINFNGGASFTGEIDGNSADIVNIGANGQGGSFAANGEIESVVLNVVSGDFSVNSSFGAGTALSGVNVFDGSSVFVNANIFSSGALDLDGDINIDSGGSVNVNSYTSDADSGNINFGISVSGDTLSIGSFSVTGAGPLDLSQDTVSFSLESLSDVLTSQDVTDIIVGNTGATILPTVVDTSFLYDYSLSQSGDNVDLAITRQSIENATTSDNNATSARLLLETFAETDIIAVKNLQSNLSAASTESEFNDLIDSTQSSVDGSVAIAQSMVSDSVSSIIHGRLHDIRSQKNRRFLTGVASGDGYERNSSRVVPNKTRALAERRLRYLNARDQKVANKSYYTNQTKRKSAKEVYKSRDESTAGAWVQAFGTTGEQAERDNISSYEVQGAGISFGIDTGNVIDNSALGVALTLASHDLQANDANDTDTSVNTYQVSLYGSYDLDNDYYLDGIVSYSLNDIRSERSNVGGLGSSAVAEYDSGHYAISSEFGKTFEFPNNVFVQTGFGVVYEHIEFEDYTEVGGSGLNLTVQQDALNALKLGPKVDASIVKTLDNGLTVIPQAGLGYKYDIIQDEFSGRSSFQDAVEDEITLKGFGAQAHSVDLDLGVDVLAQDWQFQTGYSYTYKEDFTSHTGSLKAKYKF